MIQELDHFLRKKRNGVLSRELILAEMSPYTNRPEITFIKLSGKAFLILGSGGDLLTEMEFGFPITHGIYSFARYSKKTGRIRARGPLVMDDHLKKGLRRVLSFYYRDDWEPGQDY